MALPSSFLSCGHRDHQGGHARDGSELTSETRSFLKCQEDLVLAVSKCPMMAGALKTRPVTHLKLTQHCESAILQYKIKFFKKKTTKKEKIKETQPIMECLAPIFGGLLCDSHMAEEVAKDCDPDPRVPGDALETCPCSVGNAWRKERTEGRVESLAARFPHA